MKMYLTWQLVRFPFLSKDLEFGGSLINVPDGLLKEFIQNFSQLQRIVEGLEELEGSTK